MHNEEKYEWTPEQAAAARRVQDALDRSLEQVKSPGQADAILARIEKMAGNLTEEDVANLFITPSTAEGQASAVEQAARLGPEDAIIEAAKQIAVADLENKRVLDEAIGVTPEPESDKTPATRKGRSLLRQELLKRLKPYDAIDVAVFIGINGLPHHPIVDRTLSRLSWVMTGGYGWLGLLALGLIVHPKRVGASLRSIVPALWLSTAVVEYGVKRLVRRKRPFISIIQAVVVGRKPGSYSFPSGHSAAAFAGDVLLTKYFPEKAALFRAIALTTAFSRVYLGKHYPGDVVAGSLAGAALAGIFHRLIAGKSRRDPS